MKIEILDKIKKLFEYKHDIIIPMNIHPSQIIVIDRKNQRVEFLENMPYKYDLNYKILYVKGRINEELIIIDENETEIIKVDELMR